jgi:hypothetical protein
MEAVLAVLSGAATPLQMDATVGAWTDPDGRPVLIALDDCEDPDEWLTKVTAPTQGQGG